MAGPVWSRQALPRPNRGDRAFGQRLPLLLIIHMGMMLLAHEGACTVCIMFPTCPHAHTLTSSIGGNARDGS